MRQGRSLSDTFYRKFQNIYRWKRHQNWRFLPDKKSLGCTLTYEHIKNQALNTHTHNSSFCISKGSVSRRLYYLSLFYNKSDNTGKTHVQKVTDFIKVLNIHYTQYTICILVIDRLVWLLCSLMNMHVFVCLFKFDNMEFRRGGNNPSVKESNNTRWRARPEHTFSICRLIINTCSDAVDPLLPGL